MDIEVVDMPEMVAGCVRGDLAHAGEVWGQLGAIAGPAGLMGRPGVMMAAVLPVEVIRAHDAGTPTPPGDIEYSAAILVPDGTAIPEGMAEQHLPGGQYARATYVGPYDGLAGAWGSLTTEWLPASGHRLGTGVCYEVYRDDPASTPAAELRTELYVPVA